MAAEYRADWQPMRKGQGMLVEQSGNLPKGAFLLIQLASFVFQNLARTF